MKSVFNKGFRMRKIEGTMYYEHGDYEIYVGDDGIYFTKKTEITWIDP